VCPDKNFFQVHAATDFSEADNQFLSSAIKETIEKEEREKKRKKKKKKKEKEKKRKRKKEGGKDREKE